MSRAAIGVVALTVAALMLVSCSAPQDWRQGMQALPEVRLDLREAADAAKLRQLRQRTEQTLAHADTDARTAARAYLELGRHYMAHEFYVAAEACLLNVVALDPGQRTAHYLLGTLRMLDGRPREAEAPLRRALALAPGDGFTRLRLGDLALAAGDSAAARGHFEAARDMPATALAARAGIGRSAAMAGEHELAIRELRAVLAEQPGADALRHPLAQALREQGDSAAARAELARAGSNPLPHDDPILDALSALVTGARSLQVRARRAREAGDLDGALHHYRLALEVDPDFALAHYGLGQVHVARGAFEAAAAAFRQAVAADPALVEGWLDLAAAEQRLQRVEAARAALERLLRLAPEHPEGRLRLAGLLYQSGHSEAARAELERLLQRHPLHRDALQSLLMLLLDSGHAEQAQARLARAMAAATTAQERARVMLIGAHAALRHGDHDAAADGYRAAVESDPDLVDAWHGLGQLALRRGERAGALDALQRASRLDPRHAEVALTLARLHMAEERWSEARHSVETALAAGSDASALVDLRLELLVAAPEAAARDGERALELIETLRRDQPQLRWIELRAYALAELGDFEAAAALLQRLLQAADGGAAPEPVRQRLRSALTEVQAARPLRMRVPDLPSPN